MKKISKRLFSSLFTSTLLLSSSALFSGEVSTNRSDLGFFIAAVLIATLSAPFLNAKLISLILLIPPPTVIGTKILFVFEIFICIYLDLL